MAAVVSGLTDVGRMGGWEAYYKPGILQPAHICNYSAHSALAQNELQAILGYEMLSLWWRMAKLPVIQNHELEHASWKRLVPCAVFKGIYHKTTCYRS